MNRLSKESSPYLRQHAGNPVDWYPWGEEALERARREEKPILLSVGYAACHWCHVMERESFEDEETARLMNERFVNIKVDREERPDVDAIYMQAVQAMTGQGGWPMTAFLTPEGEPFYGGTYFPPDDRHGLPSFRRVLGAIADAWATRRGDVARTTAEMRRLYAAQGEALGPSGALDAALLERAARGLAARRDARHGGCEGAPKFPQTMALDFLLRHWRRTGAAWALDFARDAFRGMARGGIYDQVGGGFHRYSVDAQWLVPHFEKMLYDNALLARLGVHLWQATGDAEVRRVTEETLDWLGREMTDPSGGFHSSLDADSEGEEGKFYVWSAAELDEVLGDDAPLVREHWGVTAEGNFEGHNILHVAQPLAAVAARRGMDPARAAAVVARARIALREARERRPRPGRDEKVLAGWNGLMLRAVADAARVLGRADDRRRALANGEFLFRAMVRDGRVARTHTAGDTRLNGYLEDYAAIGLGALALHELTLDGPWLARASSLADAAVEWFWDEATGSFFDTSKDHERLITRPRDVTDNAVPSGSSLAVELLLRVAALTGDGEHRRRAARVLEALAEPMARHAIAFGHLLGAADVAVHGAVEVALVGEREEGLAALAAELSRHYVPGLVLAAGAPGGDVEVALLRDRPMRDGRATAYVCRGFVCDEPTTEPERLGAQLESAARAAAR
jgi:uncharacterized protein YyaL (SSP411 family)